MVEKTRLHDPAYLRHSVLDFRQMSAFVQEPLIFERAEGVSALRTAHEGQKLGSGVDEHGDGLRLQGERRLSLRFLPVGNPWRDYT